MLLFWYSFTYSHTWLYHRQKFYYNPGRSAIELLVTLTVLCCFIGIVFLRYNLLFMNHIKGETLRRVSNCCVFVFVLKFRSFIQRFNCLTFVVTFLKISCKFWCGNFQHHPSLHTSPNRTSVGMGPSADWELHTLYLILKGSRQNASAMILMVFSVIYSRIC